jgi:multiple sugar transport system substrate-binding protein
MMNGRPWKTRLLPFAIGAVVTVLAAAGCSGTTPGGRDKGSALSIAGYKDTSGHIHEILDAWNSAHPKEKVKYIELPTDADAQHQQLAQAFLARSSIYDVVIADDTWTSEFASKKWLAELPKSQFSLSRMFPASVDGGTYNNKLYTIPYTASAQILYYRKDLVPTPPKTWAELITDCRIAKAKKIGCYSGQFAQYEGLSVTFNSAVASAGGRVLSADGTQVLVDSPQAKQGLDFLVNGFKAGYIPKEAITYQETESQRAFQQGNLMFLANYPFVYPLAATKGPDSKVSGKFDVAPIPGLNGPGVVSTGGHMMGVSNFSKNKSGATDFVKFFTSHDNARQLLIKQSYTPVWKDLYQDSALSKQFPFLPVVGTELNTATARPKSKNYVALSLVIQKNVYAALQGRKTSSAALRDMAGQLRDVIAGK